MCALAGVDPCGVINASPEARELLIEAAQQAHKLMEEANKKARTRRG
jgi:cell division septum initiation protein DivIVA